MYTTGWVGLKRWEEKGTYEAFCHLRFRPSRGIIGIESTSKSKKILILQERTYEVKKC